MDSLVEDAGFEPSVPRDTIKTSRGLVSSLLDSPPNVRVGERELVPRGAGLPPRDRRFESCSLQGRVHKPSVRVNGPQRFSQNPLALSLRIDIRRIEKGDPGIHRSRNQREPFSSFPSRVASET